jgi:hypothetical protein
MGALTEHHQCPRRFGRVTDALFAGAVGGAAGAFLTFALQDRPAGALVLAAAALGAVLAHALRQAIRPM